MIAVESAESARTATAANAGSTHASSAPAAGAEGQFSGVLALEQQAGLMFGQMLARRTSELTANYTRLDRSQKTLQPSAKPADRERSRPAAEDETERPSARDRAQQLESRDRTALNADQPDHAARQKRTSIDASAASQADSARMDRADAVANSDLASAPTSVASGSTVSAGSPVQRGDTLTNTPAMPAPGGGPSASPAGPANGNLNAATQTPAMPTGQAEAAVNASAIPVQAGATAHAAAGVESASAGAVRGVEGAGRPAGNTSSDFHALMQQGARTRQMATASTRSAGPTTAGGGTWADEVDLASTEGVEKLARLVRSQVGARHAVMTLRLDPPELGAMRVEVRLQNQQLSVQVQTDTQAGHDALRHRLGDLKSTLEQHGISVDRLEVELRGNAAPAAGPRDGQQPPQSGQYQQPSGHEAFGSAQGRQDGDGRGRTAGQEDTSRGAVRTIDAEPVAVWRWTEPVGQPAEPGVDLIL